MAGHHLKLACKRYRLPFRQPIRTAHGLWSEREGVLISVTDSEGRTRYGEAAPVPWFGTGSADGVETILRTLGEWVERDVLDTLPASEPTLHFALRMALMPPPPAVNSHLPVAALLPAGKAALQVLDQRLESGFRVFKWKVGVGDPADERSLLDDLFSRLPAGARLRLDANGAWDRREAERWLGRVAGLPVEFIEQPVPADQSDLLLGLAGDYPTTLALDESVAGAADVERWLDMGWRGVLVVKPTLLADPVATLERLSKANADIVFSSALETCVAGQAALRFAFAWPGKPRALGFGVWPLFNVAACNGPTVAPFVRNRDVEAIFPAGAWTAAE